MQDLVADKMYKTFIYHQINLLIINTLTLNQ